MIKQENHVYLTIGDKMTLILRILLEISSKLGTTYFVEHVYIYRCVYSEQLHMHGMAWLILNYWPSELDEFWMDFW